MRSFLGRNTRKPCFRNVVTGRCGAFRERELGLPTKPKPGITQVMDAMLARINYEYEENWHLVSVIAGKTAGCLRDPRLHSPFTLWLSIFIVPFILFPGDSHEDTNKFSIKYHLILTHGEAGAGLDARETSFLLLIRFVQETTACWVTQSCLLSASTENFSTS